MNLHQGRHEFLQSAPSASGRSVTLLGATGSIGASTLDLIKRDRDRFRVEAVTANKNVPVLAALARETNARFAAVGDPAAFHDLKNALSGTGIEAGAGESAVIEAAQRPAEWVMASDYWRSRSQTDARGGGAGRNRRACKQRNLGLRRSLVHASRRRVGRHGPAG